MIINNKKLYNNRCNNCAYRQGKKCDRENWFIPQGNICISYLHKNSSHLVKKSKKKEFLSENSSWSKVIQVGSQEMEIFENKVVELSHPHTKEEQVLDFEIFNPIISIAINKKTKEFYNMIPKFLYHCNCGDYCFSPYCSACDNNDLVKVEISIEDISGLIENFLDNLNLSSTEMVLKRIRLLDIEDLNIYEG